MVTKSLLENSIKGVGKFHKTPIFPCGIFQLKNGINKKPGDPNYDLFRLALQSTAKRLYPNYVNCDWTNDGSSEQTEKEKQDIINNLSEQQRNKLINALIKNSELQDILGIEVVDE